MNHRAYRVLCDKFAYQFAIADAAFNELHFGSDRIAETGREIIEGDHAIAGFNQGPNHVAADIERIQFTPVHILLRRNSFGIPRG